MKELGFPWISHCPIRLRHGVIIWMSMINSLVPDIHVCIEIYWVTSMGLRPDRMTTFGALMVKMLQRWFPAIFIHPWSTAFLRSFRSVPLVLSVPHDPKLQVAKTRIQISTGGGIGIVPVQANMHFIPPTFGPNIFQGITEPLKLNFLWPALAGDDSTWATIRTAWSLQGSSQGPPRLIFPVHRSPYPPADSPNARGGSGLTRRNCAGLKNYFTSNDPHHGIYSYILHSSGKKYLNTQPGRRTPKKQHHFFHHVLAYPQSSCGWHKQWYKYFTYVLSCLTHLRIHLSDILSDILSGTSSLDLPIYFAYLAYLLTFYLAYLLTFFLTFFLAFYLAYLLTFFLALYLAYILIFFLAYLVAFRTFFMTFFLAYLLTFFLTFYLAYLLTFFLAFYLAYLLTFYLTYLLTFFLAYLLTFCLAYLLTFFLTFFLAFYLAYLLTFYLTSFLTFFPLRSGSAHCDLEVAVEAWQCPLRSGSRGWGPAVPTATWKSRLRFGSTHWDLELVVEVRQCPLGSGARGGGPAVPTGIWTARRRRRRRWRRRMRRRRRRRRRTALIKSNNPHLAGGEKQTRGFQVVRQMVLDDWGIRPPWFEHVWHMFQPICRKIAAQDGVLGLWLGAIGQVYGDSRHASSHGRHVIAGCDEKTPTPVVPSGRRLGRAVFENWPSMAGACWGMAPRTLRHLPLTSLSHGPTAYHGPSKVEQIEYRSFRSKVQ